MHNLFDSVVFDVDSTLVTIEGLDFLAKLKKKENKVKELTEKAMGGELSMRKSMKIKMKLLSPSYFDLVEMGKAYLNNITPGAKETVSNLRENGLDVWIVTGNFQPAVGMLAKYLSINKERVITNNIFFDKSNNYLGFDEENPLSNNGGKVLVLKKFKKKMGKVVFVGDGSTDLETKRVADLFIGFGGVVNRPAIQKQSRIYVTKLDLRAILSYIF